MMSAGNKSCNELLVDVDGEMRAESSARPPVNRDVAMMMHVLSSSGSIPKSRTSSLRKLELRLSYAIFRRISEIRIGPIYVNQKHLKKGEA